MNEEKKSEELTILETESGPIIARAETLTIAGEEEQSWALEELSTIRRLLKTAEEIRKKYTKPLNDHVKMINADVRKATDPLRRCETHLNKELREYRARVEAARRAEEARIRKLAEKRREKAEAEGRPAPVPQSLTPEIKEPPKTVATSTGAVTFRTVRKWELEDIAAVPREYLLLDRGKITKLVKAGVEGIPGIRIYTEEETSVR